MFPRTLASYSVFLFALPAVVHAKDVNDGLYVTGVSISLLILQNGVFGADAAWTKLKKQFQRLRIRGNDDDEETEAVLPEGGKPKIPKSVKKLYRSVLTAHLFGLDPQSTGHYAKHIRKIDNNGNDAGEEAIRKVLGWRSPDGEQPHPLDDIFPVGGELKMQSCTSLTMETFTRLPRRNTDMPLWRAILPSFGEVDVRRLEAPESVLQEPGELEEVLLDLVRRIYIPSPIGGHSPAKVQAEYGLQTALDTFTVNDGLLVEGMRPAGSVVVNAFVVHSLIECRLTEMLRILELYGIQHRKKRTVRHARMSLTLQLLRILSKLRSVGLVPPPLTAHSFTLNPSGKVFLFDYVPLLREQSTYVRYDDGELVESTNKKRQKVKGGAGVPHALDLRKPDLDAASVIQAVWSCSRATETESEATTSASDVAAAEVAGSSEGGAAGGDFSPAAEDLDCDNIPEEVVEIIKELQSPAGAGLAGITSHPAFRALLELVVPSSEAASA